MKNTSLILVRHGQSEWNEKNLFTGWENPGLTKKGTDEAKHAGLLINDLDIEFDHLFTSVLDRAKHTGAIILENINQKDLDSIENKALNERFYGDLQGLNKDECSKNGVLNRCKFGEDLMMLVRLGENHSKKLVREFYHII